MTDAVSAKITVHRWRREARTMNPGFAECRHANRHAGTELEKDFCVIWTLDVLFNETWFNARAGMA